MKRLGLIGGMGPESTIEYYKGIVYGIQKRGGVNTQFPELTIESINIFKMLSYCNARDHDSLVQYLLSAIHRTYKSGAEVAALAANTPHIVFESLKEKSPIPLISIVTATRDEVYKLGLKKVGLIGTQFTMNESFFYLPFKEQSIGLVCPSESDKKIINSIIVDELECGIFNAHSKCIIVDVIERMALEQGISAVILGCTELPLLLNDCDIGTICLNTLQIHVSAIIDAILDS